MKKTCFSFALPYSDENFSTDAQARYMVYENYKRNL